LLILNQLGDKGGATRRPQQLSFVKLLFTLKTLLPAAFKQNRRDRGKYGANGGDLFESGVDAFPANMVLGNRFTVWRR
jgi:hypothetical protein